MRSGRKMRQAAALAFCLVLIASSAEAGEWLADKSGCRVWDPNPQLDETVTWSGGCSNGYATGLGKVEWMKDGARIETDQGAWQDGKQAGKGEQLWPIGHYVGDIADGLPNGQGVLSFEKFRYEGEFRDGKPNGTGSLIQGDQTVRGTWKDGCFQGGRKISIGIPLSACR